MDATQSATVQKWLLQTVIAECPWGLPMAALDDAFERMFSRKLDIGAWGFRSLAEMVDNLTPEIFVIQEPSEVTDLIFPDYPQERILHDARLFSSPAAAQCLHFENSSNQNSNPLKPEQLIALAALNRDEELPDNVVLPGDEYEELILPMRLADVRGARGVYQVTIVSAKDPDHIWVHVRNEQYLDKLARLSPELDEFFAKKCHELTESLSSDTLEVNAITQPKLDTGTTALTKKLNACSIDAYGVPEEFLYPGFACLAFDNKTRRWERCSIVTKNERANQVLVETVDFGGTRIVSPIDLYLMPKQFLDIPKQGLLVSLMGVKPIPTEKNSGSEGSQSQSNLNNDRQQQSESAGFAKAKEGLTNALNCASGDDGARSQCSKQGGDEPFIRRPRQLNKWPKKAARRVRDFSNVGYYLDCLVVDPAMASAPLGPASTARKSVPSSVPSENSLPNAQVGTRLEAFKVSRRALDAATALQQPTYEVLLCDRVDDELDILLNEILIMELHACRDETRTDYIADLSQQFKNALAALPRPHNPLYDIAQPKDIATHTFSPSSPQIDSPKSQVSHATPCAAAS